MRYAAQIEYDGTMYHGWQYQNAQINTVQMMVENALSTVADHFVRIHCAGRTDAGVHAVGQIIHFESNADRRLRDWVFGVNANLPHDISIHWVKPVSDTFHARFDAIARRYCYTIYNNPIRPAINRFYATWQCLPLDHVAMQQAAETLVGEHDFTSFRAKQCQAKSAIKTIEFLDITRDGSYVKIDIKANAFLHHMVRNIAGVLMTIGCSKAPITWTEDLLKIKSRADGGVTASPFGLTLTKIYYPQSIQTQLDGD